MNPSAPLASTGPLPTESKRALPSVVGYVAAALLLAVGVAAFLAAVLPARVQVREAVFGLQRVTLPSDAAFDVSQPGPTTLFYEKRSVTPGGESVETPMLWDGPAVEAIAVDVPGVEAGTVIPSPPWAGTGTTSGSLVYHVKPYVGESLATIDLPAPGRYRLAYAFASAGPDEENASEPNTASPPAAPRTIAIGEVPVDLLKSGLTGVYGGAAVLGVAGVVAAIVAVITWSRRRDAKLGTLGTLGTLRVAR